MNLSELKTEFRRLADDRVANKYLYDEALLARYASQAEAEAAYRARLIYDDTSTFLTIPVLEDTGTYRLPQEPEVYQVDYATITFTSGGRPKNLDLQSLDWIRDQCDWQTRTGRPEVLVHERGNVRIWPLPTDTYVGTLKLGVYRAPRDVLEDEDDEPEIPVSTHIGLVDWMLHLAYSEKDGEASDKERAEKHLGLFVNRFGDRITADDRRRHNERRSVVAPYGGIR